MIKQCMTDNGVIFAHLKADSLVELPDDRGRIRNRVKIFPFLKQTILNINGAFTTTNRMIIQSS